MNKNIFKPSDIEHVTTSSLTPYARNSRTHSQQQVKQIAASIREFGFINPIIIDKQGTIIAGHGRLLAAEHLQMDTVPCVRIEHMTDTQRRAYVIADNKLALNAGWDEELLKIELDDLHLADFDLSVVGFDADELSTVMGYDDPNFAPGSADEQGKLDELAPKYVTCPNCKTSFDTRGND